MGKLQGVLDYRLGAFFSACIFMNSGHWRQEMKLHNLLLYWSELGRHSIYSSLYSVGNELVIKSILGPGGELHSTSW